MKKASSLSELGFDADGPSFFRHLTLTDGDDGTLPRRRLIKISVIGAGNVGMAIAQTIH